MDKLLEAVGTRLAGDATLTGVLDTVAGSAPAITQRRSFVNPKEVDKPRVVYQVSGGQDRIGLHGAATDLVLEADVWGYGDNMLADALAAMARIDELLLRRMEFAGGGTLRWRVITEWQPIDDTDPNTIHYQAQYTTRYWSDGRIAELVS